MRLSKTAKKLLNNFVTHWEAELNQYKEKFSGYLGEHAALQQDIKKQHEKLFNQLESAKKSKDKKQISSAQSEYDIFLQNNKSYFEIDKAGNYSVIEQPYNIKQVQSGLEIIKDFLLSEKRLIKLAWDAGSNYAYYRQRLNQIDGKHRSWVPAIVEPELSYPFAVDFKNLLQSLIKEENFILFGTAERNLPKVGSFPINDTVKSMIKNIEASITFYEHVLLKKEQSISAQKISSSDSIPPQPEIRVEPEIEAEPYITFSFEKDYNSPINPDTKFQNVSAPGQIKISDAIANDLTQLNKSKELSSIEENSKLVKELDQILKSYSNDIQRYKPNGSKNNFKIEILNKLQEALTAYRYGISTTEENQAVFNEDFLDSKVAFYLIEKGYAEINDNVIDTLRKYTKHIEDSFADKIDDNYFHFFAKQKETLTTEFENEKDDDLKLYYDNRLGRLEACLMWHNQILNAANDIQEIINSENFRLTESSQLIEAFNKLNLVINSKSPFETVLFDMVTITQRHVTEHNLACDNHQTYLGRTGDFLSVLKSQLFNLLLKINSNNDPELPRLISSVVYEQAINEKDLSTALELAHQYSTSALMQGHVSDEEESDDEYQDAENYSEVESDDEYFDPEEEDTQEINDTASSSDNNINSNNLNPVNQKIEPLISNSIVPTVHPANNNRSTNAVGTPNQIIEEIGNTKNNSDEYEFDFIKLQQEWQRKSRRLIEPRSTKTRKIDILLEEINKGEFKDEINKVKLEKIYQACKTWLYAEEKRKVIESSRVDNVLWLKNQAEYSLFIINNPPPEDKTQSAIYGTLKKLSVYINSVIKLPRGLQAIKNLLDKHLEKDETKTNLWKQYQLFDAVRKICSERLDRKGLTFFSAMSRSKETEKLYKTLYFTELTQDTNQASITEVSANSKSMAYDLNRLNTVLESLSVLPSSNQTTGFSNRN